MDKIDKIEEKKNDMEEIDICVGAKKFNEKLNKLSKGASIEDLKAEYLSMKQSLRKNRLFEKAKHNLLFDGQPSGSSYAISFEQTLLNQSLKSNFLSELKNININIILAYIKSQNLQEIKTALFTLRCYITNIILNIKDENERNIEESEELINILCTFLTCNDKSLQFEASWCLINLQNFKKEIEIQIYKKEYLNNILNFYLSSDIILLPNAIHLILNSCMYNIENKIFFIESNILISLCDYIDKKVNQQLINLIVKCILNISNFIKDKKYRQYLKYLESVSDKFIFFFHEFMKAFKLNETNICLLLLIFAIITYDLDNETYLKFYSQDFLEEVHNFYNLIKSDNSINANSKAQNNKVDIYKRSMNSIVLLFQGLFQGSSEQIDLLLDFDAHQILKECLINFKDENRYYLKDLLFSLSNISLGTIGQIDRLFSINIYQEVMSVASTAYFNLKNQFTKMEINIFRESFLCITFAITGTTLENAYEIASYDDWIIYDFIKFSLNEFFKETEFATSVIKCLARLMSLGDKYKINDFTKDKIIKSGIEDILRRDYYVNTDQKYYECCSIILDNLEASNEEFE